MIDINLITAADDKRKVHDIKIVNGDFFTVDSDSQNAFAIMYSEKGEFKEHPLIGLGINNYLLEEAETLTFLSDLRIELRRDNITDYVLSGDLNNLKIDVNV